MKQCADGQSGPADEGKARFDELYDRAVPAYGLSPTPELQAALEQIDLSGRALDLGAGAGRDTLALARAGFRTRAVDQSARGMARLREFADQEGLAERVDAQVADVTSLDWADERYSVIVAGTLLDHLDEGAMQRVWRGMIDCLDEPGLLFVEVHTTDDPGSDTGRGRMSDAPVSESAVHVQRYFRPNELLEMAIGQLRVLRYEERLEWDHSHGRPHQHGKATLLAVRSKKRFAYYGYPDVGHGADGPASPAGQ